jgi:hypothetical protein
MSGFHRKVNTMDPILSEAQIEPPKKTSEI